MSLAALANWLLLGVFAVVLALVFFIARFCTVADEMDAAVRERLEAEE